MEKDQSRAKMLGEVPIPKLLKNLALPGIIAMLVNAIYNIVDTMFVGLLNNTSAMAAVSVAFPLFIMIAAFGQMFGIGAASYISRLLGEKNKDLADTTASTTFFTSFVSGIILTTILVVFMQPILKLFGATSTILPYAKEYSYILALGSVITISNMTLNNMIRAEGNAKYSMIAISLGAILNIALDPILMFGFDMGVQGAALATVLAQVVSFIFLISYYIRGKSYIKISPKLFKLSKSIYNEIFKIGIATFARQGLSSLSLGLLNVAARPYGDAAVAGLGVSLRVFSIAMFVVFGYNQGLQPVAGYSYGSKKYDRLKESISLSLKWTTAYCILMTVIYMLFAPQIISAFSNDPAVIDLGTKALRATTLCLPFLGFQQVYAVLFQALGKGKESFTLSIARQGIFLIPSILILPKAFGLNGVLFSQPLADVFTIILTGILAIRVHKFISEKIEEQRDMLVS